MITKGISFLTIPFFTWFLKPNDFGIVSLFVTFENLLIIIIGMNLQSAVVRYFYDYKGDLSKINSVLLIIFMNAIVIVLLYTLISISTPVKFFIDQRLVVLLFTTAFFQICAQFYFEVLRAQNKAFSFASLSVIMTIINNIGAVLLLFFIKSDVVFWRILMITSSSLVVGLISIIYFFTNFRVCFNKKVLTYFIKFALPLIPFVLSSLILHFSDRIMISIYFSDYEVGIYSLAYNIASMVYMISIALNRAYLPYFMENAEKSDKINIYIVKSMRIFTIFYIGFLLIYDLIIILFTSSEYLNSIRIIPAISIGYLFFYVYSLYSANIYYFKKNIILTYATIIASVVNLILNFALIPVIGYEVAALTTSIAYLILLIFIYIYDRKILLNKIIPAKFVLKYVIVLLLITLLKYFLSFYIYKILI